MQVDIYVRERSGSREMRIPILPESIKYSSGGVTLLSYDIINMGEIAIPTGTGIGGLSWGSEFPGKLQKNTSMQRGPWKAPSSYISMLEDWRRRRTPLNVLATNTPINMDVYLEDFNHEPSGAFGDVLYDVKFIEDKFSTAMVSRPSTSGGSSTSNTKRTAKETSSYTIKKGDTLWAISQKFLGGGAKWETIYNANKSIIEQTAKKYGRSSSNHGWWIYPGVTISIPK